MEWLGTVSSIRTVCVELSQNKPACVFMDMKERVTQHNSVAHCVFLIALDSSAALWHSRYTDNALVRKIKSMLGLGNLMIY